MAPTTKKFQCNECGHQVQRPLAPLTCPACGKQRVGLFKDIGVGASPTVPTVPGVPAPGRPGIAAGQGVQPINPIGSPPVPGSPVIKSPAPIPATTPVHNVSNPQAPLKTQPIPVAPPQPVVASQVVPAQPSSPTVSPEVPREPAPAPKKKSPPKSKPKTPAPPSTAPPTAPPRKKPKAKPRAPEPPPIPAQQPATTSKPSTIRGPVEDIPEEETETFAPAAESSDRVVWQFPEVPPGASKRRPLRNCPAVGTNGNLIAAIGSKVVALTEKSGKLNVEWSYSTGGRIPGSPALGVDDSVYVHSADGLLHCLAADGQQAWAPANVGKPLGWASPVVDDGRNIWICGYSGGLMKLNSDGSHINRRFFRSREKFDSTGVLLNGVFHVGCDDGFVYAIKLEDRRGHNLWDQKSNRGLTDWFVNSAPAIGAGPTIVASSRDDCVYAFALDGQTEWKTRVTGQMLASPVIDGQGRIFVTASRTQRGEKGSGALVCISGNSHQIEWEYPTDAPCESTPVVGDDKIIYFGDNSGIIHAVDSEGNRVWTTNLGSPVRSAGSIPWAERVVFGLDNETLVALECSSQGVDQGGWPKYMGTLGQSGTTKP